MRRQKEELTVIRTLPDCQYLFAVTDEDMPVLCHRRAFLNEQDFERVEIGGVIRGYVYVNGERGYAASLIELQ